MANPNDARTKRRQAMGDDPNKVAIAPQPLPGAPQGAGNQQNYPFFQNEMGEMGQRMGDGPYQFPYGDLGAGMGPAVTPIGFAPPTGTPQFLVPGTGNNPGMYNTQMQPDQQQMASLEPMYDIAQAQGLTEPNGLNNRQPPAYAINEMGMAGRSPDMGPIPGGFPANMPYMSPNELPVQGMQDAQMASGGGMNTKSGSRNA